MTHLLGLSRSRVAVMGILNVTPDSFSDGGRFHDPARGIAAAVDHAHAIARAGARILDLGGESTRPGSDPVTVEEELARVVPVLEALPDDFPLPISIDTRRSAVAEAAHARGATILNDTAALRDDPELAALAAERGMTVVLMHRRGTPATMQSDLVGNDAPYTDVVDQVRAFFEERVECALEAGIAREKLILDPGIGFGKRFVDNDRLLAQLDDLRLPEIPLLVGASRKAFLGRFGTLGDETQAEDAARAEAAAGEGAPADARLPGSLAVAAICAAAGVEILRVHDVAATVGFLEALRTFTVPARGGAPARGGSA